MNATLMHPRCWKHYFVVCMLRITTAALAGCLLQPGLQAQKQAGGPYSISGTIVNASTGLPLDRASVSIALSKDFSPVQSMQTSADGHFEFDHLPASKYALTGSRRGFITSAYDEHEQYSTAIATGEGLVSEGLILRLTPDAVISGVVAEDSGDPVENAKVSLYRQTHDSGTEKVQLASSTNVDDTGAYEFAGLAPGDYFIAASGRPWYAINAASRDQFRSGLNSVYISSGTGSNPNESSRDIPHTPLDLVYATTFYPDTTSADDATPIPLKGGDRVQINFALHPVPALHLTVRTPMPQDLHKDSAVMQMPPPDISQEVFGAIDGVNSETRFLAPGQMEISIPPGQYQVHLSGGPGSPAERVMTIDMTSDQAMDTSTGALTAEISGKLALLSGEAFPENTVVMLTSGDGKNTNGTQIQKDGNFEIANVLPGKYRINAWANGKHLFIAKLAATGAEVEQQWIKTASSPVMIAATVYADPNLEITGFAKKDGKPAPGAMIVLVPHDPVNNRDFFRRDQSDSDGSFDLRDVIPGKYTVVAIEDGWTLNWAEPEVIAHYLSQGQSVTMTERNSQTTSLKEAVEVQAK